MEERPVSLLEWAYEEIKHRLFTGGLQPGEKIIVGQLAQSLSISPTPVKEALNRLVAEGLMIALPRRGFMVKRLTLKEIHDIMDCRIMMEVFAAKQAVENFSKHRDIQKNMLEVLKKLESIQTYDYVEATHLEQIYHGAFIELTENEKLIDLYNILFGVGFAFYVYSCSNHPMERHRLALHEHKLMYEYLEKGNVLSLENFIR
ncbi:MAG: GntR family transcriptional regulator, partial [Hydrogenoanaerobacterium sp.]